jgi:hypothetical protein
MIESDFCQRFFIYDEGRAAYGTEFLEKSKKLWMRNALRNSEGLEKFYKSCKIDYRKMSSLYSSGVKFYELMHKKLDGLVSFFPDAFPGYDKINLPISPAEITDLNNVELVILPPVRLLLENKNIAKNYIDNLNSSSKQTGNCVILKPHPSDGPIPLDGYRKLLGVQDAIFYNDFAKHRGISPHRETAFMGFKRILSYGNSTELYIDQLSKIA